MPSVSGASVIVVGAREHASIRWQGYMNGAVETGGRAATEIAAARG